MGRMQGLTSQQVLESRAKHGNNVLTPPPKRSLWSLYIEKYKDPLIRILLITLLLSVGLSLYQFFKLDGGKKTLLEPLGIFTAIVLATTVGFIVEVKANKKFEILNKSQDGHPVKVKRDGHITQVPRRDIVVGDVVLLETGEQIPADGRLIDSVSLSVDESALTGEPHAWKTHRPSEKDANATYAPDALMRGSSVIEGHGVMVVERVGDATEYGQVATEAQIENTIKTPLMQQLDGMGRLIARSSYLIAALILLGRIILYWIDDSMDTHSLLNVDNAMYVIETIMIAVTLIVVSVPEGLPMSVTLSLALSMNRMLKTNNLVRRMHACETMGAATIICTDKTGTLTQNQMQVMGTNWSSDIPDDPALIRMSLACNATAHLDETDPQRMKVLGNPTEGALLLWLREQGCDYMAVRERWIEESQLPFSTERKFMATVVSDGESRWLLVKGAPEIVMSFCGLHDAQDIESQLAEYQRKAMRTLAFAYKRLTDSEVVDVTRLQLSQWGEMGLNFLGFVAISDAVRADVPQAIADCHNAGVRVIVVTGDNPRTAVEVARQVGIWDDDDTEEESLLTGAEFAAMSDEDVLERIGKLKVLARARPSDKARLVELFQSQGEVVAVTGDGTNDAPALKKAQVGLSMGDGTHVARQASDITILDNSFASINKAVLWGRSLYRNIQRFILFQLTVNVCACLVVGVCAFYSKQVPLTVTQMLWVNLIMDTLAALGLASLPPNSIVMRVPPRRAGESIISPEMKRFIFGVGCFFALIMLVMFYIMVKHHIAGGQLSRVNPGITRQEMSMYFTTFVALQFWNMFNARSFATGHSAFHNVNGSRMFFAVMALIFVGQVLIVRFGGDMFNVEWIGWNNIAIIFGVTSLVLFIPEIYRKIRKVRQNSSKVASLAEKN